MLVQQANQRSLEQFGGRSRWGSRFLGRLAGSDGRTGLLGVQTCLKPNVCVFSVADSSFEVDQVAPQLLQAVLDSSERGLESTVRGLDLLKKVLSLDVDRDCLVVGCHDVVVADTWQIHGRKRTGKQREMAANGNK